ncbi:MAG: tRNA threonylcarbamoyladenosine dehydratase [Christensenellales bacterium]
MEIPVFLGRTARLMGRDAVKRLMNAKVAVFGLGGVGSYAAEALARSGVGSLLLVDGDDVEESNINRQLFALRSTIGMPKVQAAQERIADINPDCGVEAKKLFYLPGNEGLIDGCDVVIDAMDTVAAKLALAEECAKKGIQLFSAMGAGNKLDPERLKLGDIYATSVCPLCRVMRHELKKRGIGKLTVVWSDEAPKAPKFPGEARPSGRPAPASCAFVPPVAGLMLCYAAVKYIVGEFDE